MSSVEMFSVTKVLEERLAPLHDRGPWFCQRIAGRVRWCQRQELGRIVKLLIAAEISPDSVKPPCLWISTIGHTYICLRERRTILFWSSFALVRTAFYNHSNRHQLTHTLIFDCDRTQLRRRPRQFPSQQPHFCLRLAGVRYLSTAALLPQILVSPGGSL
jgi:hypothetical protein